MVTILAVDDDPDVLGTLERVLEREGFDVDTLESGVLALDYLHDKMPDMVILDIMMPEMDGIAVCNRLRHDPRYIALPILFLTAKGTTDDIVDGLNAGADDYVVKPFELAELRARVYALLRRGTRGREIKRVLQVGDLRLDSDTYQATVGARSVQLTSTEHRLLRYFMENPNQALSHAHLLQMVWDYPEDAGDPDLVRAHVRNLRCKIEELDKNKRYISTVHSVGYMIKG